MSIAKRILLIDDEVYMQQVIQICLESATSWQVSVAGSGRHDARYGWTDNFRPIAS
jgi:CheY-like chemotaxis protein